MLRIADPRIAQNGSVSCADTAAIVLLRKVMTMRKIIMLRNRVAEVFLGRTTSTSHRVKTMGYVELVP